MRDLRQPDPRIWPWLCAFGLLALGALQVSRAQAPAEAAIVVRAEQADSPASAAPAAHGSLRSRHE
jgi:hypothetical protein